MSQFVGEENSSIFFLLINIKIHRTQQRYKHEGEAREE